MFIIGEYHSATDDEWKFIVFWHRQGEHTSVFDSYGDAQFICNRLNVSERSPFIQYRVLELVPRIPV